MTLPEIKLKKVSATVPPSTALPERIEKAKVLNTGDRGTFYSWGDLN
jgi:hypothetical protein